MCLKFSKRTVLLGRREYVFTVKCYLYYDAPELVTSISLLVLSYFIRLNFPFADLLFRCLIIYLFLFFD